VFKKRTAKYHDDRAASGRSVRPNGSTCRFGAVKGFPGRRSSRRLIIPTTQKRTTCLSASTEFNETEPREGQGGAGRPTDVGMVRGVQCSSVSHGRCCALLVRLLRRGGAGGRVATVDPAGSASPCVAPNGNVLYNYLTTMDVGSTFIRVTRTAAPALGWKSFDSLLAWDCQRKADRGGTAGAGDFLVE
jgi:hypothetical protein